MKYFVGVIALLVAIILAYTLFKNESRLSWNYVLGLILAVATALTAAFFSLGGYTNL